MARVRNSDSADGRVSAARHASRCARVVALALVAVGGAACTPDAAPTPAPTPTYTCTANAGACTPQQAEKEAKAAKDHEAAKLALNAGLAEYYRILSKPAETTGTAELQRYLAEDELTSAVGAIQKFRARKRVGHGAVTIATATFETKFPEAAQNVLVCEDGAKYYTTDESGGDRTPPGVRLRYTATLKLLDGMWKLTQSTDSVEVKSCDE